MRTLNAMALTPRAFAPYGDVVCAGLVTGTSANQGTAVRFDRCARLTNTRSTAPPNLAVFRAMPQAPPLTLRLLEKHPCSSQTFLPLLCTRFLVCVAPSTRQGLPDVDGLLAFLCHAGQGINYHAGVWHHPIVALDAPAEFAMLAWEDLSPLDCVEHQLEEPALINELSPVP